jgi:hypothetical protein
VHGVDVAETVALAQCQASEEVMEDHFVQHYESGLALERFHDPVMRFRIIANLVNSAFVPSKATAARALDRYDIEMFLKLWK